ncbi:MAG: DNA translocase FtsK [Bacteroidales bacterium]|jgi:S-DNA-T family DNA segregation ATPase FtsK/SpoIIIE|nr:DNA translocase FtsK [Bacteroidales bacterium]
MSKNKRIKPAAEDVVEQIDEQELIEEIVQKETKEAPSPKQSKNYLYLAGVFLLLVSLISAVSFVSFFFVGHADYDLVTSNGILSNSGADGGVRNAGGALFGKIAYYCVYCGFGLATLIFPVLLFLVGMQILGIRKFRWYSLSIKGIVSVFWVSTLLGSFFKYGFYGTLFSGSVGIWCSTSLELLTGKTGLFLILFFVLIAFLALGYNYRLRLPEKRKKATAGTSGVVSTGAAAELGTDVEQETVGTTPNAELPDSINENDSGIKIINRPLPAAPATDPTQEEPTTPNTISAGLGLVSKEPSVEAIPSPTQTKEIEVKVQTHDTEPAKQNISHFTVDQPFDPTLELSNYKFPPINLLNEYKTDHIDVTDAELRENRDKIVATLNSFKIEIKDITATIGPTVTLYEIVPAEGVRINKIKNLEDDIALSLSALGIRIIAPMPGRGTIGIEIPNKNPVTVPMRDLLQSPAFANSKMALPLALGKTISNEPYVIDLVKMPHLLVAGATGMGKSVGLNAIIASLLYKKHPALLKFVMVDPKKVELSLYEKIERHFLAKLPDSEEAVITDTRKVVRTLNSLCKEMDTRYDLLKSSGTKNIAEYNAKFVARKLNPEEGHKFLCYIVVVVDEFADLIMTAGKEVEMPIARIAQLARAVGIHMIIATQRPSVNIITGTIKANFPARIAFRVQQKVDSRTILDMGGADQLIGKGDMLISTGNSMVRLQCAFIDTPEIERVADFIGEQRGYPSAYELPDMPEESGEGGRREAVNDGDRDELFEEAARMILQNGSASASMLQRKLKLGYNRAGRIIDQMEALGIVGPFNGKREREILIKDPIALDEILHGSGNSGGSIN